MRKGWMIILIISAIVLFAIGVVIGVYSYQKNQVHDSNQSSRDLADHKEKENSILNEAVSTSVTEEKVSPNCTIVEKQYFKGCDHLIKDIKEIPTEWINYSQDQMKEQYPDWNLESFSNNQVIVSQEKEGYCDEHYIIKEHDGVIGIYNLNESGEETFKEDTEIATRYFPEEDLEKLQEGIEAIGEDQLHKTLEDFE